MNDQYTDHWRGVVAPIGLFSPDGRILGPPRAPLMHRPPIPLRTLRALGEECVTVGYADRAEHDGLNVVASGRILPGILDTHGAMACGIDAYDAVVSWEDDGYLHVDSWLLRSVTLFPEQSSLAAFPESRVFLMV